MKKKNIVICAMIAVVTAVGVWLSLRPKALRNITASFAEQTTRMSEFSFVAEKGDRVKFSFQSDINAGDLEIIVCASNGKKVYVLDHAKALETYYTFSSTDIYTLKAEYTEFIGNFKIAVYPANES